MVFQGEVDDVFDLVRGLCVSVGPVDLHEPELTFSRSSLQIEALPVGRAVATAARPTKAITVQMSFMVVVIEMRVVRGRMWEGVERREGVSQ